MMLDMRWGERTNLEMALDVFGLPNGRAIQPASRCRDSLGTPRRRLPSIRPLPSSDVGMQCASDPNDVPRRIRRRGHVCT